ncbi:MAG TPA: DUF1549 domain-containing protein [Candidatus Angelobacter sp.]|nr:DUF1549 domain-containing protein [Candidatus Angelobacter sp.]
MKLWVRNAVFLVLCLAVTALVVGRILKPQPFAGPKSFNAADFEDVGFKRVVDRVDQAFAEAWKVAGVEPVRGAPDLTVARRLSLALTGTIPSLEEIRAFEAHPTEQRLQWWLSHLFEDRRCNDYLAERFARVLVGVEDGPFIVYRRHRLVSWLSDQLSRNRPYDELVRDLISSEGIWTTKPEVNFITVTVDQNNKEEGPDERKLAARVSRAFLGVRIDCVQCHNDMLGGRWKQQDFHQLAAFFARAEMSMTGVRDNPNKEYEYRYLGKSDKEIVPPKVPFNANLLPADGPLRQRLAAWVTHQDNRPFAREIVNRASALLFNRPLHKPIDQISLEGPFPPAMEILADDLIAHKFDLQRLIRVMVATRVFQLDSRSTDPGHPVTPGQEAQFASFPLTRLRPEQVAGSVLQSAKLKTIDADSHVLVRIVRFFEQNDFLKRYGDIGEDEFDQFGGTIPQRLVMMNGKLIHERTKEDLAMNSATRIGALAPDNQTAVETAYLATLTRRPTPEELGYFVGRLRDAVNLKRPQLMEDLFWTLINSTEFSWNH